MEKFDRLIEEHIPRLRRYARALAGDRTRADDLVQDTLERAWGKFHLWRRGSDLRAWLFSIMHNVYVNGIRKSSAAPMLLPLEEDALNVPVRADQEDGLQVRDVHAALGCLSQDQREVLLLVGLEEMRYEEVAKILDVPLGTVMSRLSRGRERLRQIMAGGAVPALRVVK
ncbi:RNA polymerase subunit sigma-24 [Sulfuricella sp. T08]|uniref:RNA polymerase sigma factor n=1 Tax=Sulfuricella sp. T08 TaxID=1632857 RepID=UPI0006179A19|nr:RNA polymerase sigma factor [Sulfuricella sp. T08]GAO36862.1 RNA polymerase subunit sigma-24 [Sulfuricella sp. T08]